MQCLHSLFSLLFSLFSPGDLASNALLVSGCPHSGWRTIGEPTDTLGRQHCQSGEKEVVDALAALDELD